MGRDHRRKISYYETECGGPLHDVRRFFEFLILEGAQAALSGIGLPFNVYRVLPSFDAPKITAQAFGTPKVKAVHIALNEFLHDRPILRSESRD